MIFSNFGIWNFDSSVFWDIDNIIIFFLYIYMYVMLVVQALVFHFFFLFFFFFFLVVGGGGLGAGWGVVLNLLWQKRRMGCTGELNRLVLLRFKTCREEEQHVFICFIFNRINESLRVQSTYTA